MATSPGGLPLHGLPSADLPLHEQTVFSDTIFVIMCIKRGNLNIHRKAENEMMSQIEIWNMEEYCSRKNRERQAKRAAVLSGAGLFVLIAGIILTAMSSCLIAYILKMTVAMTGVSFLITGIVGALAGLALVALSLKKVV